jgi:5,10-methenyltetrahydromethanopterin hydrogenase
MTVLLYPNGIENKGNFFIAADYDAIEKIQVVDNLGRVRYDEALKLKDLRYGKRFDLSKEISSGVYYIKLIEGNHAKVVRMLVD